MQDFLTLWTGFLGSISSFLMTEPVIWFVGCFVLFAVAGIFLRLIRL